MCTQFITAAVDPPPQLGFSRVFRCIRIRTKYCTAATVCQFVERKGLSSCLDLTRHWCMQRPLKLPHTVLSNSIHWAANTSFGRNYLPISLHSIDPWPVPQVPPLGRCSLLVNHLLFCSLPRAEHLFFPNSSFGLRTAIVVRVQMLRQVGHQATS